jgi:hypothetical protein
MPSNRPTTPTRRKKEKPAPSRSASNYPGIAALTQTRYDWAQKRTAIRRSRQWRVPLFNFVPDFELLPLAKQIRSSLVLRYPARSRAGHELSTGPNRSRAGYDDGPEAKPIMAISRSASIRPGSSDRKFLTTSQLAKRWQRHTKTLKRMREDASGPAYVKIGGAILYPLDGVEAHEAAQTFPHQASEVERMLPSFRAAAIQ